MEQIPQHKKYNPVNRLPTGWKEQAGNATYVSELLDYEAFQNNETIIIQSCAGAGKTTASTKHMVQEQYTLLSIVTRTSLVDQHCKSFNALCSTSYQDVTFGLCDEDALVFLPELPWQTGCLTR
jgi:hypothetical protein